MLPFGKKYSGTEAQGPYRAAAAEMHRGRHANCVDDWIGYGDIIDVLLADFANFLEVCEKYQITLGISKTRFGYGEARSGGGPEQQKAFDTIRDRLLEGVHLAASDFSTLLRTPPRTEKEESYISSLSYPLPKSTRTTPRPTLQRTTRSIPTKLR
jgi:hypothetical protein